MLVTRAKISKGLLSNIENGRTNLSRRETQDSLAHALGIKLADLSSEAERWAADVVVAAAREGIEKVIGPDELDAAFPNLCSVIRMFDNEAPLSKSVSDRLRRIATEAAIDFPPGVWLLVVDAIQAAEKEPVKRGTGRLTIVRGAKTKKQ